MISVESRVVCIVGGIFNFALCPLPSPSTPPFVFPLPSHNRHPSSVSSVGITLVYFQFRPGPHRYADLYLLTHPPPLSSSPWVRSPAKHPLPPLSTNIPQLSNSYFAILHAYTLDPDALLFAPSPSSPHLSPWGARNHSHNRTRSRIEREIAKVNVHMRL